MKRKPLRWCRNPPRIRNKRKRGLLGSAVLVRGMVCEEEYELVEQIGRGSFGKVYRAQHDSGEVHAIKVRTDCV